jgi:Ca2+-dependent lipid-binding protein
LLNIADVLNEAECQFLRANTLLKQLLKKLKGLGKENVGIFYAHLEYSMAIWYILWSFVVILFIFIPVSIYYKKNLATLASISML